jgi:CheY-like chemotaxis protein
MATNPLFEISGNPALVRQARVALRVLLVDDDPYGLIALDELIRATGFQTMTSGSGKEALAAAEVFQPDGVLLDIGLPDMSGNEVARRIRESEWGARCLLIAVTGFANEQRRNGGTGSLFDHYEIKPVSIGNLRKILAQLS